MKIISCIFEIAFGILAFLLLLSGDYEMSILASISADLMGIERKLEEKK